jgi:phosphate transport system protein
MATHLEQSLQRDIDRLSAKFVEMGALAERALKDGVQALVERNRQVAYSVILRDQRIDELEKQIDRLCLEFILRQQPVAGHLRFTYAGIKINGDLERVGDYAESIARQVLIISATGAEVPQQAFGKRDAELAKRTIETEDEVDALRHQINADLLRMREEDRIPLDALSPLITIVNRFERVADQAKSICQEVLYVCTGEYTKHVGTEVYRVLFVDEHNSCRSPMAEGIGNSLGQPKFVFASAGLEPGPLDGLTQSFLRDKGIDISRHAARSAAQVPHLEHYQIIVALADEARKVFPPPPTKTVCLDWSVKDPSTAEGSPDEVRASYEHTYQFLREHVQDLVEAILGDETS